MDVREKTMKALNQNLDHLEARGIELTRLADGAHRLMQFMMPLEAGEVPGQAGANPSQGSQDGGGEA